MRLQDIEPPPRADWFEAASANTQSFTTLEAQYTPSLNQTAGNPPSKYFRAVDEEWRKHLDCLPKPRDAQDLVHHSLGAAVIEGKREHSLAHYGNSAAELENGRRFGPGLVPGGSLRRYRQELKNRGQQPFQKVSISFG